MAKSGRAVRRISWRAVWANEVLRVFLWACFGACVARVGFPPLPSLFGMAVTGAVLLQGHPDPWVAIGAIVGMCSVTTAQQWPLALGYPALVAAWAFAPSLGLSRRAPALLLCQIVCLLVPCLLVMPISLGALAAWGLSAALCVVLTLLMSDAPKGLRLLRRHGAAAAGSLPGLVACAGLVLAGLCGIRFFFVPASGILACAATMIAASLFGAGAGVCVGLLSGLSLLLGGRDLNLPLLLVTGGLLCGLMPERRGWLACLALLGVAFALPWAWDMPGFSLLEVLLGGGLALLFIPALRRALRPPKPKTEPAPAQAANACANLLRQTQAFFADTAPPLDPQAAAGFPLRLTCRDCPRFGTCHERGGILPVLSEAMLSPTPPDQLPAYVARECVYPNRLLSTLQQLHQSARTEAVDRAASNLLRQQVAHRLEAVATWMSGLGVPAARQPRLERRLTDTLCAQGVAVNTCTVTAEGQPVVCLTLPALPLPQITAYITKCVNQALGTPMQLQTPEPHGKGIRLRFVPRARATLRIGSAVAPATGPECGDGFYHTALSDGRQVLLVCDAMGHGKGAAALRERLMGLVESILGLGIDPITTLQGLNALLCQEASVRTAAVDLLIFDPSACRMVWAKSGACPSVLLRGDQATLISSEAPPLGALEQGAPQVETIALCPGDTLVLCTDGLWPALEPSVHGALGSYLRAASAQTAAQSLLSLATEQDDALAVVIHVKGAREEVAKSQPA